MSKPIQLPAMRSAIRLGLISLALYACSTNKDGPGNSPGNLGSGSPNSTGASGGPNQLSVQTAMAQCRSAGCVSGTGNGDDALRRADFTAAFEAYQCGQTPEAAFGAGLTTLITSLESDSVKQMLADLGLPPFKAKDLFGPSGLFTRYASRWKGSGSVQQSEDSSLPSIIRFDHGQQHINTNNFYLTMRDWQNGFHLSLSLNSTQGSTFAVGQRIGLGCSSGGVGFGQLPQLELYAQNFTCLTPPLCDPNAGSITITKFDQAPGTQTEYQLENVLLSCSFKGASQTPVPIHLNGTVGASVVTPKVDLSDLHPLIHDSEPFKTVPPGVTLQQLAEHSAGFTSSLALASCYFNAAGDATTEKVFDIPAEVFGGTRIPVTRGDAKLLASVSSTIAALLSIVQAYDLPMELRGLLCGGGASGGVACLNTKDAVNRINIGIGGLHDATKFALAKALLESAFQSALVGFDALNANSVIVRNNNTTADLDKFRELTQWALQSLASGSAPVPHVTPVLRLDLQAFFASPPNPAAIHTDPLVYDAKNNRWDFVEAFFDQAIPSSHLSWTRQSWGSYMYTNSSGTSSFDQGQLRLYGYGILSP